MHMYTHKHVIRIILKCASLLDIVEPEFNSVYMLLLIVVVCLPSHSTVTEVISPTICKVSITLICLPHTQIIVHQNKVTNAAEEEKPCDCSYYECRHGNVCT